MALSFPLRGPWAEPEIDAYLDTIRVPLRLSAIGASGFPIVVSLWFIWEGGRFLCATGAGTALAQALGGNDRCGFEVAADAPPYRGLRGQALATLVEDGKRAHLRRLLCRYLGDDQGSLARWLLTRPGEELTIALQPQRMMSWDYSDRMATNDSDS